MSDAQFSYKLTDTNIYGHLLYRIHKKDAEKIDGAGLLNSLKQSVQSANQILKHSDCNILVFADPDKAIPEEGIGGLSWGSDWIRIDIDPNTEIGLEKALTAYLSGMVAHELHHAKRSGAVGYGESLSEVLITEGLAQAFQEQLYPQIKPLYAHHLSKEELKHVWEQSKKELDSKSYDHMAWFYGTGKLKRWAGYSLGYAIVQHYFSKHKTETPATVVDVPANQIFQETQDLEW